MASRSVRGAEFQRAPAVVRGRLAMGYLSWNRGTRRPSDAKQPAEKVRIARRSVASPLVGDGEWDISSSTRGGATFFNGLLGSRVRFV